jgi:hypothetical protein
VNNNQTASTVIEGSDNQASGQPKRRSGATTEARLLNLNDAAAYLGISYWTMRDLVNGGQVPTIRIPSPRSSDGRSIRRILVDRRDLDAFIERNKEMEQ